jgi:hypothetical protein
MAHKEDAKSLVDEARLQGWVIEDRTKSWMCYSPDGVTIVNVHKTPSDWRAHRNNVARMRKGGLTWPPPKKKG